MKKYFIPLNFDYTFYIEEECLVCLSDLQRSDLVIFSQQHLFNEPRFSLVDNFENLLDTSSLKDTSSILDLTCKMNMCIPRPLKDNEKQNQKIKTDCQKICSFLLEYIKNG